jgi:hypothetical protein
MAGGATAQSAHKAQKTHNTVVKNFMAPPKMVS